MIALATPVGSTFIDFNFICTFSAGQPNARVVLLKGYDQRGFRLFSNYTSQKAKDLVSAMVVNFVLV